MMIQLDLAALILLHCFGKHQLPHPLDALLGAVDGEMVRLGLGVEELLVLGALLLGDECEGKGLLAGGKLALTKKALLESSRQLGAGCLSIGMQSILVDVNVFQGIGIGIVSIVHGKLAS